jgi:hypothetical protein
MDSSFEATATVQRSKQHLDLVDTEPRTLMQHLAAALDVLQTCLRVSFLTAIFAPLFFVSPLALKYGWSRELWMRWFRFSLEVQSPSSKATTYTACQHT